VKLSVCIITLNEEPNIGRTLKSVQPLVADGQGEIIVVDSGSTDKTVEIAKSYGAKVFTEPWKGFAAQKNSDLEKAQGEWILSLDADEELEAGLPQEIESEIRSFDDWVAQGMPRPQLTQRGIQNAKEFTDDDHLGFEIPRKNLFLGRWIRHGGFYPDRKLRLFLRGRGEFRSSQRVHETLALNADYALLKGHLLHHAYPTLSGYIEHMNKYSSLGAGMEIEKGRRGFSAINIVIRPWLTFIYNYFFGAGFLDGKEGLLLHMYHAVYVSWKYAKVWELSRSQPGSKKSAAS